MIKHFNTLWSRVPVVVIDFETTHRQIGVARAVEVGLARFEDGKLQTMIGKRVDPGIPISPEATNVHGIFDADVKGLLTIEEFFAQPNVQDLFKDAQLCAYNADFDKRLVPGVAGIDLSWPWLDPLTMVRVVDKYASGSGRHQLGAVCQRHGVHLSGAHNAMNDAVATGELLYKIVPKLHDHASSSLGELLEAQQRAAAQHWFEFNRWLSRKTP